MEVLKAAPVTMDRLEEEFMQPCVRGDQSVLLELEVALHDKSETFSYHNMSVLAGIVRDHLSTNCNTREPGAQHTHR